MSCSAWQPSRTVKESDKFAIQKGSETHTIAGVEYQQRGDAYFEQRQHRRHARVWSLWALGVGAVISGDFFGWNFGLAAGGFWGLFIATVIIPVMYVGLCYSIAEMSPALPHTGGAYSFGRSAMDRREALSPGWERTLNTC